MERMKNSWFDWLPWRRWKVVQQVEAADEVPERLGPRTAVFVGTREHPKWLAFDCPCGRGHRILIPLERSKKPHWRLAEGDRMTLSPSVDAVWRGRRCHYVIRSGKTIWIND